MNFLVSKERILAFERIQERAFRIFSRKKTAACDELLKKAGLTTLYNLLIIMYKVKHKLTPIFIQNMSEENGAT